MKTTREFDPVLVEAVERALAPYRGKLSPELIEHMREEALALMSAHPYPVALLQSLQRRPPPDESHELARGVAAHAEGAERGDARGKGRRRGGSQG
ncbi:MULTISPECIES: hypothetical protein [Sorangium]|uniref:Uncharacterized protein n=1 Tax=Sorangium cellulosum TaxID=56 RepID=A0A150TC51_SORCE|nr:MULTISPECIES: hypothetical protein [Sorangium]AUX30771.1 uncharacterized protein SOCE836_028840 [Sorangium cellulosum]KYF84308.1 hypothetical protein BE18_13190 [Sorangium cellulosum]KYG02289.1 hypothetical protein BE20_51170 [Sorangium cellulosum]WCQ90152.1 hypothetical protein NQZ70_02853 [Sorangium sp. Soce836]